MALRRSPVPWLDRMRRLRQARRDLPQATFETTWIVEPRYLAFGLCQP